MKRIVFVIFLSLSVFSLAMDDWSTVWDVEDAVMVSKARSDDELTDCSDFPLISYAERNDFDDGLEFCWCDFNFYALGCKSHTKLPEGVTCAFCYKMGLVNLDNQDDQCTVVEIFKHGTTIFLNQMPHQGGHFFIMPKKHVTQLTELTAQQRLEFIDVKAMSVVLVGEIFKSKVISMNVHGDERVGSGMPHFHEHVIPRVNKGHTAIVEFKKPHAIAACVRDAYNALKKPFSRLKKAFEEGEDISKINVKNLVFLDDE